MKFSNISVNIFYEGNKHDVDTDININNQHISQQWWQSKVSCCNACWVPG